MTPGNHHQRGEFLRRSFVMVLLPMDRVHSLIRKDHYMQTSSVLRSIVVISFFSLLRPAPAATLDIGAATSSNWTVSGGGALNATPYVVTGSFGRGQGLSAVTLTGV